MGSVEVNFNEVLSLQYVISIVISVNGLVYTEQRTRGGQLKLCKPQQF